ncbi:MAG: SIMPL domain-containing protein [Chloroflexota bacterium]
MRGIRVRGTGHVERAPDVATVTLGAQVQAAGASDAQRLAGERMQGVLASLAATGVEQADITTDRVTLEPTFDYGGQAPRATGYQATQTVRVRVRDLALLGAIVDGAVGAGANQVAEVALGLLDPAGARADARALAMADARRAAEELAMAAGVRLGLPVAIVEDESAAMPGPMRLKMAASAMADGTPIVTGAATVRASVLVTFALLG